MSGFIEGADHSQASFFPERLEDWICEDNPVRIVDAFVDALDLSDLGFSGTVPANTGRPGYHPGVLLKLFIYGYLNRVLSSRRLEREANRNVEVMWPMGRLAPDVNERSKLTRLQHLILTRLSDGKAPRRAALI